MNDLKVTLSTWTDEETGIEQPSVAVSNESMFVAFDLSIDNFRKFWSEGGELLRRLDEDGPPNS